MPLYNVINLPIFFHISLYTLDIPLIVWCYHQLPMCQWLEVSMTMWPFFFPVLMIENKVYNVAKKELLQVTYTPVLPSLLCIPRDDQSSQCTVGLPKHFLGTTIGIPGDIHAQSSSQSPLNSSNARVSETKRSHGMVGRLAARCMLGTHWLSVSWRALQQHH